MVVNARQSETEDVEAGARPWPFRVRASTLAHQPQCRPRPFLRPRTRACHLRLGQRCDPCACAFPRVVGLGACIGHHGCARRRRAARSCRRDRCRQSDRRGGARRGGAPNAAIMRGDSRHDKPSLVSARSSTNFWSASGAGIIWWTSGGEGERVSGTRCCPAPIRNRRCTFQSSSSKLRCHSSRDVLEAMVCASEEAHSQPRCSIPFALRTAPEWTVPPAPSSVRGVTRARACHRWARRLRPLAPLAGGLVAPAS